MAKSFSMGSRTSKTGISVIDIDPKREAGIIAHRAALVESLLDEPKLNKRAVDEIDAMQSGLIKIRNYVKNELAKEGKEPKGWKTPQQNESGGGFFFGLIVGLALAFLFFQYAYQPTQDRLPNAENRSVDSTRGSR